MVNKKRWIVALVLFTAGALAIALLNTGNKPSGEVAREVKPAIGNIQTTITSTATVQPQNRLEIKPPINGRIDQVLVEEGDIVKAGQTLVWMSSTERAALLDAARTRGPDAMKYWEEVYKPTPLISPLDGEVIVSQDEPGQIVTSSDAVLVLSDRLIVQAQVDETDIGGIRVGQEVMISLDAYPNIKVKGKVDHIYYESKIVNNVTIYQVDILPETVPEVFRSGMTATVVITEKTKDNIALIPLEAVKRKKDGAYVLIKESPGAKPIERKIELGIADEKNVEVISGVSEADTIIVAGQKYSPSVKANSGTNPFMPFRGRPSGQSAKSK
ncbi:MAG: efflux RND transporter periplasmic adaptor subunit [Candidatus Omnitrophica bacterium]|nr:efflux RND transporter periplasmic adaptor subunit [Candidatus Omnitrophota bacterium]